MEERNHASRLKAEATPFTGQDEVYAMFPTELEINERLRSVEEDARNNSASSIGSQTGNDGSARRGELESRLRRIRAMLSNVRPAPLSFTSSTSPRTRGRTA